VRGYVNVAQTEGGFAVTPSQSLRSMFYLQPQGAAREIPRSITLQGGEALYFGSRMFQLPLATPYARIPDAPTRQTSYCDESMKLEAILKNRIVITAASILGLIASFYIYVLDTSSRSLIDLNVYTQAAQALSAGENIYQKIYTVTDRWGRSIQLYYFYPPLLAHALSLFTSASEQTLKFGWCLCNYILMLVTTVCLSKISEPSWWGKIATLPRTLIIGFFVFCFEPLYVGNGDGQVTALVLALLSMMTLAGMRRCYMLEGAVLAVAVQIKMSPVLLLLAPIVFQRWRTLTSFAASSLVLIVLTVVGGGGVQPFIDFASSLTHTVDDALLKGHVFNFVINRTILEPLGLAHVALARWVVKIGFLALALLGTICISRQSGFTYLRALGFLIICMIITSPIIWFHHFAWILLPIAIISMKPASDNDKKMKNLTIALGLYFALSQTYLLNVWTHKLAPSFMWISALVPTLLLGLVAASSYRQREP
jgi:hypothetical protein